MRFPVVCWFRGLGGCTALGGLAKNTANRVVIASKRGIHAVVMAMGTHESSVRMQQAGCSALVNLAAKNPNNQLAIAAKGGTEAVVRAMAVHESSMEAQQAGCGALGNIVWWVSGLHSEVVETAAAPLVKKALSAFPYNWVLQTQGQLFWMKLGARSVFKIW